MKRFLMPLVWLTVLFGSMLYGARSHACVPGDPDADTATPYVYVSYLPLGGAYYWYCDTGHRWTLNWWVGTLNEFDPTSVAKLVADADTPEKRAALLEQAKRAATNNPPDAQIIEQLKALPRPTKAPPSGWIVQPAPPGSKSPNPTVYKRSEGKGTYTVNPVGHITEWPSEVACNSANFITDSSGKVYHALVDRTKASMTKAGNYTPLYPPTLYAGCVPQ